MKRMIEIFFPKCTEKLGEEIGKNIKEPFPILLFGDLGVGKTVFVRGLARGIGTDQRVKSPSFTILYIYEGGRFPIYHFDLYRLNNTGVGELIREGYFEKEGVVVMEWAEKFPISYFSSFLKVELLFLGEEGRRILFSSNDSKIMNLVDGVIDEYSCD